MKRTGNAESHVDGATPELSREMYVFHVGSVANVRIDVTKMAWNTNDVHVSANSCTSTDRERFYSRPTMPVTLSRFTGCVAPWLTTDYVLQYSTAQNHTCARAGTAMKACT